jgi:dipeptidyl aminopeptidase/acylaminoacyl peptidase
MIKKFIFALIFLLALLVKTNTAQTPNSDDEEEVSFPNGDVTVSGTLIKPLKTAPYPTVMLLHGSNAQSRYRQNAF